MRTCESGRPGDCGRSRGGRLAGLLAAIAIGFLARPGCAPAAAPPSADSLSYHGIVADRIEPQTAHFLAQLVREGRAMRVDGVPVFDGSDRFLPGKIALAFADLLSRIAAADPARAQYVRDFRRIAALTIDDPNEDWGIYYYLSALNKLRQAGVLAEAVDPLTLAGLRVRLDWRTFVDANTLTLIEHPNNYYGVALGIARLRSAMGWEDPTSATALFGKILEHYRRYSGAYGFADETDGEGRFDRYSVLLSAEIAQRFLETRARPPDEVLGWLRKSVDVMLPRLNAEGEGFEYGRSLGPYASTALIEVLTAAAALNVLSDDEKSLAYAYVTFAARRYVDFWLNPATGSVDLWDLGRRTDAYRGKFRILGENLSLAHQFIYTDAFWSQLGYQNRPPRADFAQALQRLPWRTISWFARGTYDRVLLSLRDRRHVIGLPLINGGAGQHMHNPYYPIPFSPGMLAGVPDSDTPQLLPRFTLPDGSTIAPLAYFQNVSVTSHGQSTVVTFRQEQLDRLGSERPEPDERLSLACVYTFSPGQITRRDVYTPKGPVELRAVTLEFATYSDEPTQRRDAIRFGRGAIRRFTAKGFEHCRVEPTAGSVTYQTPTGPFLDRVVCTRGPGVLSSPMTLEWSLSYR